jgi:hypothetical protein
MVLDISACEGKSVYVGVASAHNSPVKVGSEDVEIPIAGPIVVGDPELEISKESATDARLEWTNSGESCQADLFEETTPYFNPVTPAYSNVSSPYTVSQRLGDTSTNYFYLVRVTCAGVGAESDRVGEFDYGIVAGY